MSQHAITSESNTNEDTRKPVPPLTAKTEDGKPYTRFADVEAEISDVWSQPPSRWAARRKKLKSETLVFLICKGGLDDDYIHGLLLEEMNARSFRISENAVKGLDDIATEQIALEVEAKVFELVWSNVNSRQAEFLEMAFAEKVRDLTRNAIERYKNSLMARRDQIEVSTGAESEKGPFEVVELRNDIIDPNPNPEELLILREGMADRKKMLQRIHDAVKDPRHFQALYLFHAEDKSLAEIAAQLHATVREIRYWKETAMHQIRVALGIETEEKREALRQRRRDLRASRRANSVQHVRQAGEKSSGNRRQGLSPNS